MRGKNLKIAKIGVKWEVGERKSVNGLAGPASKLEVRSWRLEVAEQPSLSDSSF